jgi:hypothetical protein
MAQDSSGPAEKSRLGRRRGILQGFLDRRQQAWDRVYELEEKAAQFGAPDLNQLTELLEAGEGAARRQREAAAAEARRARRRMVLRFELPLALMGVAVLLAIAALNYLWLSAVDVDYIESYLRGGFQVALLLPSWATRSALIADRA